MTIVDKIGIYDIPAEQYHADPCPTPSLSSSIAVKILDDSPRHAWTAHPRLNPNLKREDKRVFDIGTAAHAIVLEGHDVVEVIEADSFRAKAAQEQRDAAYAAGRTPLLEKDYADVLAMVEAARAQLDGHPAAGPEIFAEGHGLPEQAVVWQEDGEVWCRMLVDWLPTTGHEIIWDYKTTGGSAHPDIWARNQLWATGRDIQPAFYSRGAAAALGWREPEFRFVVQENKPPYALSIVSLTPGGMDIANRRTGEAIDLWRDCLAADRWPGYPAYLARVEASIGAQYKLAEHEQRRFDAIERGNSYTRELLEWTPPAVARSAAE